MLLTREFSAITRRPAWFIEGHRRRSKARATYRSIRWGDRRFTAAYIPARDNILVVIEITRHKTRDTLLPRQRVYLQPLRRNLYLPRASSRTTRKIYSANLYTAVYIQSYSAAEFSPLFRAVNYYRGYISVSRWNVRDTHRAVIKREKRATFT